MSQFYFAWADCDRTHGHSLEASGFEDAAVAFAERYAPAPDAEGEVRVFVLRQADGVEHCFMVDLNDGRPAPC